MWIILGNEAKVKFSVEMEIETMSKTDNDMLKKWLSNVQEDSFQKGMKYACEKILNRCKAESMPILLSVGDDSFYISIDEIKTIIKELN